MSERLVGTE